MNSLMQLGIYNSSDSESDENLNDRHKERLPAPNLKLFECETVKESTIEQNHEGKIRNFPHEPGNWATYVYIPVDSSSEFLNYLKDLMDSLEPLNLKLVDDFHISLTRTVVLRHHWISGFVESVKNSLVDINFFRIHLYGVKTYSNEQKTRTFLSLEVDEGVENLRAIVKQLDICLKEYNLQTFYKNPSFHLSLLWCPGDRCNEINRFINLLPVKLKNYGFYVDVFSCFCTSGNKNFSFSLR